MTESFSTVVGAFEARQQAGSGIKELRQSGFRNDQIEMTRATPVQESGTNPSRRRAAGFLRSLADFFRRMFSSANEAGHYENEYRAFHTVAAVKAEDRSEEAWAILRHGAYNRANTKAPADKRLVADEADRLRSVRRHESQKNPANTRRNSEVPHLGREGVVSDPDVRPWEADYAGQPTPISSSG